MLPLADLLPLNLLERTHRRGRISLGTAPVSQITVMFQIHGSTQVADQFFADVPIDPLAGSGVWDGFYGLSYVLSGTGVVLDHANGLERTAQTGSLLQFTDYNSKLPCFRGTPGLIECSLCLDCGTGARLVQDDLWDPSWVVSHIGESAALVKAFYGLYLTLADRTTGHAGIRWRMLQLLEIANQARATQRPGERFVERACQILAEHLEPSFGISDAAHLLGCTPGQFRRRFLAETGASPAQWQQHRRLERAAELLREHPVKQVAALLGYTDPAVFSRQFRRQMGVSPRELSKP